MLVAVRLLVEVAVLDTLELWMGHDQTRAVLLDWEAREVGLSCIGDRRVGPVHWDLVLGA